MELRDVVERSIGVVSILIGPWNFVTPSRPCNEEIKFSTPSFSFPFCTPFNPAKPERDFNRGRYSKVMSPPTDGMKCNPTMEESIGASSM